MDWLTEFLSQAANPGGMNTAGSLEGGAGMYNPALGATMLKNPEAIAGTAIRAGVPPPAIGGGTGKELEFGSLLDPVTERPAGTPLDLSPPAAASDVSAAGPAAAQSGPVGSLAKSLSGVKAPPAPRVQTIGRPPAAPQPTSQIKQGELLALLGSMMGGQERKLAPTLGSVLGG